MWYLLQESPCCALYKPSMTRWESKVGITSRQLSCLKNENDNEKKRFREHVQWWALFCKGLAKLKFILLVLCFLSVNWNDWNQEMVTGILKRMEYRVVQSSSALVIKWSNYLKIFMSFLKLILKACWFNINIWRGWQGLAVKHFELSVILYAHFVFVYQKWTRVWWDMRQWFFEVLSGASSKTLWLSPWYFFFFSSGVLSYHLTLSSVVASCTRIIVGLHHTADTC